MTGKVLTKEEVILGDYDIQYGIEVYAKAYEGGESSLTGKVGYLGPFPKVSVRDDWVVGRVGGEIVVLDSISQAELSGSVRQIDLNRIELASDDISRIRTGKFNAEEIGRINTAEELLNKKLSQAQQSEIILSHNAANEPYGVDDFGRISTKARLLEDFSANEKRILMENWVVGSEKSAEFRLKNAGFSDEEIKIFFSQAKGEGEKVKVAEEILSKPIGASSVNYQLSSVVKQDNVLLKEAKNIGADDSKDINNMLDVLIRGGNPGLGSHSLGGTLNSVMEARAKKGARIYYTIDRNTKRITILAYSTKNNQKEVIKRLERLYGR